MVKMRKKSQSRGWDLFNAVFPTVGSKISKYLTETDPEHVDCLIFLTLSSFISEDSL